MQAKNAADRMDSLLAGAYSIVPFSQLPEPYQMAILWRNVIDCGGWEAVELPDWGTEEEIKPALAELLPRFMGPYGDELYGVAMLEVQALTMAVMEDEDIAGSYGSWAQYHGAYIAFDTPEYPATDRWPVILSSDDYETILDGWHRFHSYVRDGADEIPVIFYPQDHHLDSTKSPSRSPGMR